MEVLNDVKTMLQVTASIENKQVISIMDRLTDEIINMVTDEFKKLYYEIIERRIHNSHIAINGNDGMWKNMLRERISKYKKGKIRPTVAVNQNRWWIYTDLPSFTIDWEGKSRYFHVQQFYVNSEEEVMLRGFRHSKPDPQRVGTDCDMEVELSEHNMFAMINYFKKNPQNLIYHLTSKDKTI